MRAIDAGFKRQPGRRQAVPHLIWGRRIPACSLHAVPWHQRRTIMLRSYLPQDLFADLDRAQRELMSTLDYSPAIRGMGRGGYPALNVGSTPASVEVYAFEPGMDPASIDLQLERGVLTISGERKAIAPAADDKTTVHINERFAGRFRRVVSLPEDIDPGATSADYRDGVLHVSIKRSEASMPRKIAIQ
jgi:HSP20 family protein